MKRLISRIIGITIVLAVVAAIVVAFLPQPVVVETAEVVRGPMKVTVDEDGRTRIRDKYIVSAPLAGQLQRIQLRAGDTVDSTNTIIARIDPSDPALLDARTIAETEARVRRAEAAVRRAETGLERTRSDLEYAEADMARVQRAADRGAATQREVELAITGWRSATEIYNAARFEQEIAKFELELAQAALVRSRPDGGGAEQDAQLLIGSPIDGRVLRVFQESTAVVQAGTPLVELGDPTDLEIVVDVLSTDAVQIQPGAKVFIEYWGGEEALHGRVRLVEPQAFTKVSALGVEEQRVNIIIDFINPPEDRLTLGDGYRIEARIVIWDDDEVVQVPTSAMFRIDGAWAVYVIENDRATLRHIRIDRQAGLHAQVLQGLDQGEETIIHPGDDVEDGTRVRRRP
ncbi:MAG: HlyD family efflux transporter periplasmic adaptor subunit [Phycisphaerales bacterium]|nr:MAG: HlyD family efflux transporter periplasmic adaptor subunit [Phycisphaerales bacterium]